MSELIRVDLSRDKIEKPINAYRVYTNYYGIAQHSPDRAFITTYGLFYCKGIAFTNGTDGRGLLGHIAHVFDLERVIAGLVEQYGGVSQSDVYLVSGHVQTSSERRGPYIWPTIDELVREVCRHNPERLLVDDKQQTDTPRSISLNLQNGEVKEIDESSSWMWGSQYDTSINIGRRISELDIKYQFLL